MLGGLGRLAGFVLLAGASMAILAVLALLPPYAQLQQARWELDCARAGVQNAQQLVTANQRLMEALASDNVLIRRLAISQMEMVPTGEVVVDTGHSPLPPPDMIVPPKPALPDRPDDWLLRAAIKIDNPSTRRGLVFVAMASLLGAMFLFAPPGPSRRGQD